MSVFVRLPIRDWLQALTDSLADTNQVAPSAVQKAALDGAAAPSGSNPFATRNEVVASAPASAGHFSSVALEPISALTAVIGGSGGVSVARDGWVTGVSITSAQQGGNLEVQALGSVADDSWTWTPSQPVFATSNGRLTQSIPETGQVTVIGVAVSTTRVSLCLAPPARLA
jgi:hypothetical protein